MKFVFDLDGTICFNGQPVSDKILNVLADLKKQGHEVIFASARPIRDMLPVLHKDFHQYTMIGGNGSLIAKQGKIIKCTAFSSQKMSKIGQLIKEFEATYLIDSDWDYAYTGPSDHPILRNLDPGKNARLVDLAALSPITKILILTSKHNEHLAEKLAKLNIYVNKHSNEDVLDISPKGVHKWSALKMLGIEKEGYVAFGNDANDMTMFENAHFTVMIGHHNELARVAKESITDEVDLEQKIVDKIIDLSQKYIHFTI